MVFVIHFNMMDCQHQKITIVPITYVKGQGRMGKDFLSLHCIPPSHFAPEIKLYAVCFLSFVSLGQRIAMCHK